MCIAQCPVPSAQSVGVEKLLLDESGLELEPGALLLTLAQPLTIVILAKSLCFSAPQVGLSVKCKMRFLPSIFIICEKQTHNV